MTPPTSFWEALKERRVLRVGLVYLAVGWGVIEGADTLSSILDLPPTTPRVVLALVVLGFPLALALAWAFQVTPEGIERAPAASPDIRRMSTVGGVGVALLAVAGLGFAFLRAGPAGSGFGSSGLDPRRVAVLPFRVNAPEELSYLGGGFMDLISARLDGEIGPRAIDPGTVSGALARGLAAPVDVARDLGAGLVVTGSVVGVADLVVVTAELLEAASGSMRASANVEGPAASVSEIADGVVVQLLSLSEGEYTTSIASLTTASPEALKAYLLGKQAFWDGDYYVGVAHLDEALAIDSTFALAAIARADGSTNAAGTRFGGYLDLAWRHRDRLSARDLQYLEARRGPDGGRTDVERIADMERVTRDQPDRIEAWYWLFEAVFHQDGIPQDDQWEARIRALGDRIAAMDPDYYPVVDHLMFVEPTIGDSAQRHATYAKVVDRPFGDRSVAGLIDLFSELARGGDRLVLDPGTADSADLNGLAYAPWWPTLALDFTPPDFIEYSEAYLEEARRRVGVDQSLSAVLNRTHAFNQALGRRAKADSVRREAIEAGVMVRFERSVIHDALWSGTSVEDVEETVRRMDARLSAVPPEAFGTTEAFDLVAVETWRFMRDSTHTAWGAAERILARVDQMPHPQDLQLEASGLLLQAWSAARSDNPRGPGEYLDRLLEIVGQGPGSVSGDEFMLTVSTVHEEIDDWAGALESLERGGPRGSASRRRLPTVLERTARLQALTGDTASAVTNYRRYLTLMRYADESLRPEIERVRQALAELTSDPS